MIAGYTTLKSKGKRGTDFLYCCTFKQPDIIEAKVKGVSNKTRCHVGKAVKDVGNGRAKSRESHLIGCACTTSVDWGTYIDCDVFRVGIGHVVEGIREH